MAACPYWAGLFKWSVTEVPAEEGNAEQHYLGNRTSKQGCVEKCNFCIHRTRKGRLPACAEACPTGARIFGNLLDPDGEIRWVLANKQVLRLKEELATGLASGTSPTDATMHLQAFLSSRLRAATSGGRVYHAWMGTLTAVMLRARYAYLVQAREGLSVTGMNDHVSW